jgi:hypothetical protein
MTCTEEQAATKWCPMTADRHSDENPCLGSDCMLWIWVTDEDSPPGSRLGRCGFLRVEH